MQFFSKIKKDGKDAAGRCSKAYRCYDSQDWIVRFQKEANGLHPVSTGFPVARRCVREVDIRVHDYRAAGADNDTAKNRDIRINNVFMVYGIYMNDDLPV